MRLAHLLVHVAVLASATAACSSTNGEGPCVGSCCGATSQSVVVAAHVACQIVTEDQGPAPAYSRGAACNQACDATNSVCGLPQDFVQAFQAANPGGAAPGAATCPSTPDTVTITCGQDCTGRRTEGLAVHGAPDSADTGGVLASRAWLEAVSVFAFARLEEELAAHGAPAPLVRDARRARRDEVRHTAMQARLARRRGADVPLPDAPAPRAPRSLFAVALENAVEGCVRETYGAVVGLVEARTSSDGELRRAMRSIAADECRHAELAWAVHAWARPRLTDDERARIDEAMDAAIAELARVDPRMVRLLASAWRRAGAAVPEASCA